MKKEKEFKKSPFIGVVITIALYLVFFDKIASKPTDAGFWFILAMGLAIGVALSKFFLHSRSNKEV